MEAYELTLSGAPQNRSLATVRPRWCSRRYLERSGQVLGAQDRTYETTSISLDMYGSGKLDVGPGQRRMLHSAPVSSAKSGNAGLCDRFVEL